MLCLGGLICGVLLFAASAAQQIGIETTTTAKAGFLTALYVILVPLLSRFFGKKVGGQIWFCVALVLVGLYLLCIRDTLRLEWGDSMVLLCALLFALQIMAVDYFSPHVDGVRLACSQFFVTAVLSTICALLFEHVTLSDLRLAAPAILYAGLLSSAVGYTLQIVGQKGLNPTIASLAMCLESVFSALGGWLILHEVLTSREKLGAVLMFSAIVLAQIPLKKTSSKEEST